jgi:hypothetical protein
MPNAVPRRARIPDYQRAAEELAPAASSFSATGVSGQIRKERWMVTPVRIGRQRLASIQFRKQLADFGGSTVVLAQFRGGERTGLFKSADLRFDQLVDLTLNGRGWICHCELLIVLKSDLRIAGGSAPEKLQLL